MMDGREILRVIGEGREEEEYLVEIQLCMGYPVVHQFLPESSIPCPVLSSFTNPTPDPVIIHREVAKLRTAMRRLLQSRRLSTTRRESIAFQHDVFKYLFKSLDVRRRVLPEFSLEKFPTQYFPEDWYVYTNQVGDSYYAHQIFLAPRLRPTKPTYSEHPNQPGVLVPVPHSVLYSQLVSLKVIVLPCQ